MTIFYLRLCVLLFLLFLFFVLFFFNFPPFDDVTVFTGSATGNSDILDDS